MHDFKKVLAALSFSNNLREEFLFAAKFADNLEAELVVLNVINARDLDAVTSISSMGYEVDGNHYIDGVTKERTALLDGIIDDSAFDRKNLRIVFKVGHPIQEILQFIMKESVDMIIMGAKGRTNLEEVLVGSVAEKLFRKSPVTVVSYRPKEHSEKLKRKIHDT